MNQQQTEGNLAASLAIRGSGLVQAGEVVGLAADGRAVVDFPANPGAPVAARTLVQVALDAEEELPRVLLVFENGDLSAPVILGILQDCFRAPAADRVATAPFQASADGKRVTLQAEKEMELRCGKASITLRKDGKVLVKGTHITSNASVRSRIKGGSVAIN